MEEAKGGGEGAAVVQKEEWQPLLWYFPQPTLFETISTAFYLYPNRPFLGERSSLSSSSSSSCCSSSCCCCSSSSPLYRWYTYEEVWNWTYAFSSGLGWLLQPQQQTRPQEQQLSPSPQPEMIAICSKNCVEWAIADLSCAFRGYVSVPLHYTMEAKEMAFILNQTEARCIVCGAEDLLRKVLTAVSSCSHVRLIVYMDHAFGEVPAWVTEEVAALPFPLSVVAFSAVTRQGSQHLMEPVKRAPDALATVMYTSGSTGEPKGAMMTDKRWNHFVSKQYLMPKPCVLLSYEPLAHVMARQNIYIVMCVGGQLALWKGEMSQLFSEMQVVRPTMISAVPRVWNCLYAEYQEASALAARKRNLEGREGDETKEEEQLLRAFSTMLGGRTQFLTTGGAPTSPAVLQFLKKCFECRVFNGYGITETGGITVDDEVLPDVEYRLEDVPEMGYTKNDKPFPRGELCVRSSVTISGYYKNDKATKDSFDDEGWFRTGDIVEQRDNGKVVVIDRKKNVFKLSQGEFVAPEKLETLFLGSPFVDQMFIYGTAIRSFLVAVVVPNAAVVLSWARANSLLPSSSPSTEKQLSYLCKHESSALETVVLESLRGIAKEQDLPSYELPRGILLEPVPFTPENGLLTPTLKLRRVFLARHYQKRLERLYDRLEKEESLQRRLATILSNIYINSEEKVPLNELSGFDSLATIQLASVVQDEFHKEVPLQLLLRGSSVADIARFVVGTDEEERGEQDGDECLLPVGEAERDIQKLQPILEDMKGRLESGLNNKEKDRQQQKTVLLTGVTGFLGCFLLTQLLKQHSTIGRIYCLVRPSSTTSVQERLKMALKQHLCDVDVDAEAEAERIIVVEGDLCKPHLGLSGAVWEELSSSVDAVYHNGAAVNWILPYSALRDANVLATIEILEFCSEGTLKELHYISTIGVAGETEEQMLSATLLPHLSGYSATKWVAEHCVREIASHQSLPVCIYRPGMLTMDCQNGASNESDYVNRYIRGCVALGAYIDSPAVLDFTPVDYAAAAIVHISLDEESPKNGTTYHIIQPSPLPYSTLGHYIRSFGYEMKGQSYEEWRQQLLDLTSTERQTNPLYPLFPYFHRDWEEHALSQRPYDWTNTRSALCKSFPSLSPPLPTESYIQLGLRSLQARKLLPWSCTSSPNVYCFGRTNRSEV
ncbi:Long chain acyl-CoA synthetase 7, peroxisomal [Balamuthia mandrillaris]